MPSVWLSASFITNSGSDMDDKKVVIIGAGSIGAQIGRVVLGHPRQLGNAIRDAMAVHNIVSSIEQNVHEKTYWQAHSRAFGTRRKKK